MLPKLTLGAIALILCFLPTEISRSVEALKTADSAYLFIEIEAKVYRKGVEISSENPEERRWYFSNVVVQPEDVPTYSLIKQKIIPYFSRGM